MTRVAHFFALCAMFACSSAHAQAVRAAAAPPSQPPTPATKLEAFKPAAGSVVTVGFNELGDVGGVSVDAREIRDTKGALVRGMVVEVDESQYRSENAFIDTDELPELLSGLDALLAVKTNPTHFEQFEVRYQTKGALQITAFNSKSQGGVKYAVRTGRITTAQVFLNEESLRKLRTIFQNASVLLGPAAGN